MSDLLARIRDDAEMLERELDPSDPRLASVRAIAAGVDRANALDPTQAGARPPGGEVPPSSTSHRAGPAATVLLVEDDGQIRPLMERILTGNGFRVIAAARGDEAIAVDDETLAAVDILVTDVMLPGADGPTVARALEARRPGLPHLLVSGYVEASVIWPDRPAGASFLAKPYTPEALIARIREILAMADAAA